MNAIRSIVLFLTKYGQQRAHKNQSQCNKKGEKEKKKPRNLGNLKNLRKQ